MLRFSVATLFRFVARYVRVRIEDSTRNSFTLNGIQGIACFIVFPSKLVKKGKRCPNFRRPNGTAPSCLAPNRRRPIGGAQTAVLKWTSPKNSYYIVHESGVKITELGKLFELIVPHDNHCL